MRGSAELQILIQSLGTGRLAGTWMRSEMISIPQEMHLFYYQLTEECEVWGGVTDELNERFPHCLREWPPGTEDIAHTKHREQEAHPANFQSLQQQHINILMAFLISTLNQQLHWSCLWWLPIAGHKINDIACRNMFFCRNPGSPSYQIEANNCWTLGWATNCKDFSFISCSSFDQTTYSFLFVFNSKF